MSDGYSEIEKTFVSESPSSAVLGFETGQIVAGKYKIVALLGRGGIGSVYKVEQVFLGQSFALKTLNSQKASDQLIRRFQNEARAASSLSHANLVKVIDFGLLEGQQPYLVMDLVEGMTLSEYLQKRGPLSLEKAVGCFTQVCLGLSYAHDQGVIHRDIKPSNVMISSHLPFGADGFVKVVDFGIAKIAYAEGGEAQSLTTTGEVFGSPLYMSPEQCSGLAVDHRTDIYSLGCVLFESLTGTTPFVGQNALSTMMLHQQERVPTLKEASLGKDFPLELEQVVGKLLEKAPADRYQNLGIVANDLAQLFKGAPVLGVKSDKKQSKKIVEPFKMSRRRMQLWLVLTAIGSGLIGVGVGYYLAKPQLEKNDLNKGSSAGVEPTKPSKKDSSSALFDGAIPSELGKYEQPILKAVTKSDLDGFENNFTKKYFEARGTVDKAAPDDKKAIQKGLDQFLALQKEAAPNLEVARKFGSSIEERIAVCKMRLGRYREAEKNLSRARSFPTSLEQEIAIALAYQAMAQRAQNEKRYQDSFNDFYAAAQILEKVCMLPDCKPDLKQAARRESGNNYRSCCAIKFQFMNDYKRAIELGEKANKILKPVKDKYLTGFALFNLGVAYSRDNQSETARKILSAAEKYLAFPNLPRDAPFIRAHAFNELASIEDKLGNSKKAIDYCDGALKELARFKSISKAEQNGIDAMRDKFISYKKNYESAAATASGGAGASVGGTVRATGSASSSSSTGESSSSAK